MWKWKCSAYLCASEALLVLSRLFLRVAHWGNLRAAGMNGRARTMTNRARALIGGEAE